VFTSMPCYKNNCLCTFTEIAVMLKVKYAGARLLFVIIQCYCISCTRNFILISTELYHSYWSVCAHDDNAAFMIGKPVSLEHLILKHVLNVATF
jgi:hypothetical protein